MASPEEQAHAIRLLKIHRRNLERLEEKKAKQAGATDLATDNQIEEEKANIAALEPIANPPKPPSPKIQEFVRQTTPGEIDLMMLYIQGVQINQRMTKAEEQNEYIIQEQSRASVQRMTTDDRLARIEGQVGESEQARRFGAKWYRRAITVSMGIALLALIVSCAAFAAMR